jgi:hypothetical protein
MAETEQTKVCPHCAETIKAAAKVCPYCRKSRRQRANLTPSEFCVTLTTVLVLGTLLVIARDLWRPRDFGPDKNKVLVTSFHFDLAKNRFSTNLVVIGVLTNASKHSWRLDELEIRYFDTNRKLLDFRNQSIDDFTILPNSDHAFSLNLYSPKSAPNFATCTVQVVSAYDPRVAN